MNRVDLAALAVVAIAALLGMRRGLVGSALSAAGIVAGAILGARLAPHFLPGGEESPYTPLVGLAGAALGALVLETAAAIVGRAVRGSLRFTPLRLVDSLGGLVFGGAAGLVLVWVLGAVALHVPERAELRRDVQSSTVLARLNEVVPPARLMDAIQRVDPFPAIAGPLAPVDPPDPAVLRNRGVRTAAPSVVRVLGNACGLAVSGSGWVAAPTLVVTAAHVVAGQRDTTVETSGTGRLPAHAVAFDRRNDVAVLRVPALRAPALRLVDAERGEAVAILGYPESGRFRVVPGRIGGTSTVFTRDAYGAGPVRRTVTTLRAAIRQGHSGGPAVNGRGQVATTIFAARVGADGGYGVPAAPVRRALAASGRQVSTGDCAR